MGSPNPSPAFSSAAIEFTMGSAGRASLTVFDMAGRIVTSLLDTELAQGGHSLVWNLESASGSRVPAGIYTIRFEAPGFAASRNLVVLR